MSRFQENMDLLGIQVVEGDYTNVRNRYDDWLQSIPAIHRIISDTDRNLLLDLVEPALDNTMATMTEMATRTKFQNPVSNLAMALILVKIVQEVTVGVEAVLSEVLAKTVALLLIEAGPDEYKAAMKEVVEFLKARTEES